MPRSISISAGSLLRLAVHECKDRFGLLAEAPKTDCWPALCIAGESSRLLSLTKVLWSCQHDGMPHLKWGRRFYFNIEEVRRYFEKRKFPLRKEVK
jgi:hypothetical protein